MTPHIILFLAANPLGTDQSALDREARAIQVELERSGHRDRFDFVTRWAAEPLDLLRELRSLKPAVVHFCGRSTPSVPAGHSDADRGLLFQRPDGGAQCVSIEALTQTFGAAGASVRLAVLSACYSEAEAEALRAQVDCVVGMSGSIGDDAARSFAIGFYGGFGAAEPVEAAFRQGCAAISLVGLSEHDLPRLKVRDGIDAQQLIFAADALPQPTDRPTASMTAITASNGSVAAGSINGSVVIVGEPLGPDGGDG
jgi:hypothetical protein